MTEEPVDRNFGISMSDWISRLPNNLDVDIVGLWEIIPAGRENFGISGDDLVHYARRCFIALLERGARFHCGQAAGTRWLEIQDFVGSEEEIANKMVQEWQASESEPDWYELWFSLDVDVDVDVDVDEADRSCRT